MPRGQKNSASTNGGETKTTAKNQMVSVDQETSLIIGQVQERLTPMFGFTPTKSQVIRHAFNKVLVDETAS